jgi:hypothetical protein
MPDRRTILAATPKCPTREAECGAPMRWDHDSVWICPRHGAFVTGASLVAQQSTIVARPEPAAS